MHHTALKRTFRSTGEHLNCNQGAGSGVGQLQTGVAYVRLQNKGHSLAASGE